MGYTADVATNKNYNRTGARPRIALTISQMAIIPPERLILSLPDDELEKFARAWVDLKKGYFEVQRFTGAGDMGRDVVGYLTQNRHEGAWHNYQCKQYGRPVQINVGLLEIGKILYYAYRGEFTPPTAYFFVAPRGVARSLRSLISKPGELRTTLIAKWDQYCANHITKTETIKLDPGLTALINAWDFSKVTALSVDEILKDPAGTAAMAKRFGKDPGPAPVGTAPADVQAHEMPYIRQLLDAYGERDQIDFKQHEDVKAHDQFGPHLDMQRERFFDADAFSRFYRDNTMSEEIEALRVDMLHGVVDVHGASHSDALSRVNAVMAQAATVAPSGVLARHARVPVKQGICHHFANEGRLKWQKK
jgi:hypothetical protein